MRMQHCINFKAIGEELSEISGYVQMNIYIYIYIYIYIFGLIEERNKTTRGSGGMNRYSKEKCHLSSSTNVECT